MNPGDQARYDTFHNTPKSPGIQSQKQHIEWYRSLERVDANQFLRNGFFQDAAIASTAAEDNMLVAHKTHYTNSLLTQQEVEAIEFTIPAQVGPPRTAKDVEIFEVVQNFYSTLTTYATSGCSSPAPDTQAFVTALVTLVAEGGSISRSNALHLVARTGYIDLARSLVQLATALERTPREDVVNARDQNATTPLMCAAMSVADKTTTEGCDDRILDFFIDAGARVEDTNVDGMTAYGHYETKRKAFDEMLQSIRGPPVRNIQLHPSQITVQNKLRPPTGPTAADLSGAQGEDNGFAVYDSDSDDDDDDDMSD